MKIKLDGKHPVIGILVCLALIAFGCLGIPLVIDILFTADRSHQGARGAGMFMTSLAAGVLLLTQFIKIRK